MIIEPISSQRVKGILMNRLSQNRPKGNDLKSLLIGMQNAELFGKIANMKTSKVITSSAATLAVADRFDYQSKRYEVGSQNAMNSISRYDTASTALDQSKEIIHRLSELSARSLDGTLNDADREILNTEAQALKEELNSLQSRSNFNGSPVLSGGSTTVFTGGDSFTTSNADLTDANNDISTIDISTVAGAQAAIDSSTSALNKVSEQMSVVSSSRNRLERASDMAQTQAYQMQESASSIREQELGPYGSILGHELGVLVQDMMGFPV